MRKSLWILCTLLPVGFVAIGGCASTASTPFPTATSTSLPTELQKTSFATQNPCDLLTTEDVSAAAGVQVTEKRRVPSIDEVVEAQREYRAPPPGSICSYETNSRFGAIEISLPLPAEQTSAKYWERRNNYFQSFPGSAQAIPGLGQDAWLGGGNSLRVLVREDVWITLSTQMYQPDSRDLLIRLASAALARFGT